jgi:hypothetical protein
MFSKFLVSFMKNHHWRLRKGLFTTKFIFFSPEQNVCCACMHKYLCNGAKGDATFCYPVPVTGISNIYVCPV